MLNYKIKIKEEVLFKMEKKSFHLSAIMCIVTGRILAPMDEIFSIVNFMTGTTIYTMEAADAMDACRPYVLKQYPQFDSGEMQFAAGELMLMLETPTGKKHTDALVLGWLSKLICGKYNIKCEEIMEIEPMPPSVYISKDPVEHMCDKIGSARTLVVTRK